jgi:Glucosamine 6-phosphate synthetase, contains amidotransferase and phosphosugar isomerase domains
MCGIVAAASSRDVVSTLLEGLHRVEYRGYDSAGISLVSGDVIDSRRAVGKLSALKELVAEQPIAGATGIGHTRWATHGKATIANAHPHGTKQVSVVHNGIIENFQELKAECLGQGLTFESETDTEVVAKLWIGLSSA